MMKKTLIAAAALLAGVAAQAQVNVYGTVDLSIGRFDGPGQADSISKVESGVHTGSFIGFKGQEDLGGGLKAFFVLESEIGADVGSAGDDDGFWARTSELGLSGDFGTVKLGNSRSLGFLANAAYNPFPVTGLMNTSQHLNGHGNYINSVTYTSPNLSGFTAAAQLGLSEDSAPNAEDDFGVQLSYAAGPLAAGFTWSDEDNKTLQRWQLGASYDFGVAKLFGQYGQDKVDNAANKEKAFQIGVTVPVTAQGTILASFAQTKEGDLKKRDFSIAYDHALSKRTSAYAGLKNERNSQATPKSGSSFAVGIKHAF